MGSFDGEAGFFPLGDGEGEGEGPCVGEGGFDTRLGVDPGREGDGSVDCD